MSCVKGCIKKSPWPGLDFIIGAHSNKEQRSCLSSELLLLLCCCLCLLFASKHLVVQQVSQQMAFPFLWLAVMPWTLCSLWHNSKHFSRLHPQRQWSERAYKSSTGLGATEGSEIATQWEFWPECHFISWSIKWKGSAENQGAGQELSHSFINSTVLHVLWTCSKRTEKHART